MSEARDYFAINGKIKLLANISGYTAYKGTIWGFDAIL